MVPRKQAGHMTCTRPQAERQILLATRASSTHDSQQTLEWVRAGSRPNPSISPPPFNSFVAKRLISKWNGLGAGLANAEAGCMTPAPITIAGEQVL
jgi:hypothetical protein